MQMLEHGSSPHRDTLTCLRARLDTPAGVDLEPGGGGGLHPGAQRWEQGSNYRRGRGCGTQWEELSWLSRYCHGQSPRSEAQAEGQSCGCEPLSCPTPAT